MFQKTKNHGRVGGHPNQSQGLHEAAGTIYSAKTVAVRAGVFPRRNVFGMLREVAEQVPYHEVKCGISDRTLWRLK